MASTKFRYMYNILRYKIRLLTLGLLLVSTAISAQYIGKDNYHYLDFQKKPFYYGLSLATHVSGYRISQSKFFINNDSIRIAEGTNDFGLDIHLIANLKLGEFFDLRFLPGFAFSNRTFEFASSSSPDETRNSNTLESVFAELPFHVRFKSAPYKNKRGFVIAGLKYSYDISSNSDSRQADRLIQISPHDFMFEVGAGMQFFFDYFIFSPEIKYSRGLGNSLIFNDKLNEARVLEQVISQTITLSFHFEG